MSPQRADSAISRVQTSILPACIRMERAATLERPVVSEGWDDYGN